MAQRSFGLIQDEKDERDYLINSLLLQENSYLENNWPNKVDYRDEMTNPKNQGKLGSCVAFAVCAVKEGQEGQEYQKEKITNYRKGKQYNLSEMGVYGKCKEIDQGPNSEGTSIRTAMKVLKNLGIPPEKAGPYKDTKTPKGEPESGSTMIARGAKIGSDYRRIIKGQDINMVKT